VPLLSANEHVEDTYIFTSIYNISLLSHGVSECIDSIGPYPDRSYVLVIIDTFTRWVELFYSAAATAKIAALHLLHHFRRFGAPSQLLSDRGSHFGNEVITEFTSLVGTQ
jgi:transposase InsO family protein